MMVGGVCGEGSSDVGDDEIHDDAYVSQVVRVCLFLFVYVRGVLHIHSYGSGRFKH